MANLPIEVTNTQLRILAQRKLAVYKSSPQIKRGRSGISQLDLFPLWHPSMEGLSIALRSWTVPKGVEFTSRLEEHLQQIGSEHRHLARVWPTWLKSAWPQAEIWTGWSEVGIPGSSVIPDAVAWGRIQGYETLFWLEVGDEHKSRRHIVEITHRRLDEAWNFCQKTGVRFVYAQLSVDWVHEAARWACANLAEEIAVVMGNIRKFGEFPMLEWGDTVGN